MVADHGQIILLGFRDPRKMIWGGVLVRDFGSNPKRVLLREFGVIG